ncbi:MAG: acyl-ACP--UDP-N-acetylglucosamine O-acyltransferase [Bacteroidetes bacterium]|nr:acyl-ACP--UDP-N-acetylglucosamine O-acyltransferase [Bacteroidota bacterium]
MISNLTDVHPDAKIAKNVKIDSFVSISGNVEIGAGTWIGPNVSIMDGARIGANCRIFPGAVVSADPQDMKYKGEETLAHIGDGTTIRECVTVNKGTAAKGETVIGKSCLIMAYCHVAHDCILGNHVILVNNVGLAGEVEIDDYAYLGGMVGVHQFVRIGTHAFIQGGAMVGMDIPPFVTAGRNPTKYAGINTIGLRRRGFPSENIRLVQEAYRIIYSSGLNNSLAIEKINYELKLIPEIKTLIEFVESSKRGIIGS